MFSFKTEGEKMKLARVQGGIQLTQYKNYEHKITLS